MGKWLTRQPPIRCGPYLSSEADNPDKAQNDGAALPAIGIPVGFDSLAKDSKHPIGHRVCFRIVASKFWYPEEAVAKTVASLKICPHGAEEFLSRDSLFIENHSLDGKEAVANIWDAHSAATIVRIPGAAVVD